MNRYLLLVLFNAHNKENGGSAVLDYRKSFHIAFHASDYRDFKHYYLILLFLHRADFPGLVSYPRFVRQMSALVAPLCAYLQTCYGENTDIAFIDSTALPVCGNERIDRNRIVAGYAKRGKTTMGWFFGEGQPNETIKFARPAYPTAACPSEPRRGDHSTSPQSAASSLGGWRRNTL